MAPNVNQIIEEALFLNTLPFHFPKEPVTFYFSLENSEDYHLTKLNHELFPSNIREIFPDIANGDTICLYYIFSYLWILTWLDLLSKKKI